jgi:CRISPR-associated endonuclease Cas1
MRKTRYLLSSGELKRKDNTLMYETAEGKQYIPIEDTQELMLFGEVSLNKAVLELCTQKEIILHFFNYYGYYTGSYYPRDHYNSGYMILKQAQHYLDDTLRLDLAKKFVNGAGRNMLRVLKYYRSRGKPMQHVIETLESQMTEISAKSDIPSLMSVEGHMREAYYSAFDVILDKPDFRFERRSRRPPHNELNTLISFGNSLLYTQVLSEIYQTHLDPRIGYLHTSNFRRFTLNLDVAEIFKPILADRAIFKVVGQQMITKDHFMRESGGLLLTESGKKVFLKEWEEKMRTTIKHRTLGREVSHRRLIRMELYKLQKHLMGDQEYEPFKALW